jgi:hypothetical protein
MDQWECQHFNFSPGNQVSKVSRVTIKSNGESRIKLTLDDVIRLHEKGYSEEDFQKITGLKFLSVYRQILENAREPR